MRLKVRDLGKQISDGHMQLLLDIGYVPLLTQQEANQFLEELRTVVDVTPAQWKNQCYIAPKKKQPDEIEGDFIVRYYENGVIEKVESLFKEEQEWRGTRTYPDPDGRIETGTFPDFRRA